MAQTESHYFARGNTARGAHSLYPSAFQGLNKILILSGPAGTGKSTVIRNLADHLSDQGLHLQYFHSPLRPHELEGIIITDLQLGIVDRQVDGDLQGKNMAEIHYVPFEEALNLGQISPRIGALEERLEEAYSKAYEGFSTALKIHDEWEKYYIESMDFTKASQITQELIRELYKDHASDTPVLGRHLFFGAATPKGAHDYIQSLTTSLQRRIFIKGRPGSGKSTMLKALASEAEANGIDVQVFHCGLDPNSLDMLIFPELSTAIFDSTAPHEYFPEREGDELLDMYELAIAPGTDETYADELADIKKRYSAQMIEATSYLETAEAIDHEIQTLYDAATNFATIENLQQQIQTELNTLIKP